MKKTENSAIYKEYNKTNILVVSLSNKEQKARKNIDNMKQKVLMTLTAIDNDLKQVNINKIKTKTIVNDKYDEIIKQIIQKRDQLLTEIDTITNNTTNKLLQQQKQYKHYSNQIIECNKTIQTLIKDTTLNTTKREIQIESIANKLINTRKTIIKSQYTKMGKITVDIDVNKITNKIGHIHIGNAPFPPIIKIKSIGSIHANIELLTPKHSSTANPFEYAVKYAESNDHVNWRTIIVNNTNICRIDSLKPLTNYIVKTMSRNKYGYSEYCQVIRLKTDKLDWTQVLIPSARDLYFILHNILCFDYKLMPQLYI